MLDRFAEQLKKARLKKGLSLEQMAARTRIDIKFLEAIDNGNFSFLPDLYVKAFIKQYAKSVDLDESETIKRYDDALTGKVIDEDEPKSLLEQKIDIEAPQQAEEKEKTITIYDGKTPQPKPAEKNDFIKKNIRGVTISAVVILAGAVVFFTFFNRDSTIVVEEAPYEKILEETKDRYQVKDESEESLQTVLNLDSLTLQFTNADSVDSAWVMVIYDNMEKDDFLLYPRNSKTVFAADNFKFTLGNSGVIVLKLDEQILRFEGKRGSVRHYEVTRNGIQRLTAPPILKVE